MGGYVLALTEPEAAWLAAAIDGEGMARISTLSGRGWVPHVEVANTDRGFADRAAELMTRAGARVWWRSEIKNERYKRIYRPQCSSFKSCLAVLSEVFPYLIIKRERAATIIEWLVARLALNPHGNYGFPYGPETVRMLAALGLRPMPALSDIALGRLHGTCRRGHPLDGDNVYHPPKRPTHRECVACRRERTHHR